MLANRRVTILLPRRKSNLQSPKGRSVGFSGSEPGRWIFPWNPWGGSPVFTMNAEESYALPLRQGKALKRKVGANAGGFA